MVHIVTTLLNALWLHCMQSQCFPVLWNYPPTMERHLTPVSFWLNGLYCVTFLLVCAQNWSTLHLATLFKFMLSNQKFRCFLCALFWYFKCSGKYCQFYMLYCVRQAKWKNCRWFLKYNPFTSVKCSRQAIDYSHCTFTSVQNFKCVVTVTELSQVIFSLTYRCAAKAHWFVLSHCVCWVELCDAEDCLSSILLSQQLGMVWHDSICHSKTFYGLVMCVGCRWHL